MSYEVPKFLRERYGSSHAFRREKRRQLKSLVRAYNELRQGCAFFPVNEKIMQGIAANIETLKHALSVNHWGR